MKNVLQPLAKSVSIPLGLTAAASAADAGINQKVLRSGRTTLIIFKQINEVHYENTQICWRFCFIFKRS